MRFALATAAVAMSVASAGPARPDNSALRRATQRVIETAEAVQSVPGASPALAVVIVGEEKPTVWVEGSVDAGGAAAADRDTPFYIASMTKAYVGLLAVELDRKGVLPLDARLADFWPGLSIPDVPDAGAVTLRELLSHRVPFRVSTLNFRTANTDDVPASEYRRLMESYAEPHDRSFSYSNLGYLLYGAAAELRTGRDWRDLLKEHVLGPLALDRTSPLVSDFSPREVTMGHQWLVDGYHPVGKSDALMHAAGGVITSPDDMASWLQAWLRPVDHAIPAESFATAATQISAGDESFEGIHCTGYALGWYTCEIGGAAVHLHGGAYSGVRAGMAWSKELGAGIAVLTNSDSMTGGLSAQLVRLFFSSLADPNFSAPSAEEFAARYAEMVQSLVRERRREVAEARSRAEWNGWSWHPTAAELGSISGEYRNARLGILKIARDGDGLSASLGELRLDLEPAAENLFGSIAGPLDPPEPLRVEVDPAGEPIAIIWNGERFRRFGG